MARKLGDGTGTSATATSASTTIAPMLVGDTLASSMGTPTEKSRAGGKSVISRDRSARLSARGDCACSPNGDSKSVRVSASARSDEDLETRPLLCARWRWPENAAARTAGTGRDARRTVVPPKFAGKNSRHLAGGSHPRSDRYNATTARGGQVSQKPPQSGGKWARPRLNYYPTRFEEDTACLRKQ